MKTSIKVLTSIRGDGGWLPFRRLSSVWPPEEWSTSTQQENFPFNKDISFLSLQKAEQLYNSYLDRRQFWNTTLQLGGIFGLKATFHFVMCGKAIWCVMGVISGMSRQLKSHFTLTRWWEQGPSWPLLFSWSYLSSSSAVTPPSTLLRLITFVWYQHDFPRLLCCHQPYFHF